MKKTLVVVSAVIVNDKNEFLLTKRVDDDDFNDKWQFPGGGLEFSEDPEQALKREIKEELSVDLKIIRLIPKVYSEVYGDCHLIFLFYLGKIEDNQKIILNEEASDYGWFSYQELIKLPLLSKVRDVCHLVLDNKLS